MQFSYEIYPRRAELGAGWNLVLLENDLEVGGGVFAEDEYGDALETAEVWIAAHETASRTNNALVRGDTGAQAGPNADDSSLR